ncbi:MAG: nuclear transport factor 2 family protein [Pseudomonadota bacterium]
MSFLLAALALAAPDPALAAQIEAADTALFGVFFTECDPARLATMVAPDFEMYHDKDGFVFADAASLIGAYGKQCEAKKAPDAWRSRRELIPGTMRVDPVPGFGAIEEGDHVFYERKGDGPEKLVGRAHFVQLWRSSPQGWKLARVFSYRHEAID